MRGATVQDLAILALTSISIHAPHAGSDAREWAEEKLDAISIHAPHAGSDRVIY